MSNRLKSQDQKKSNVFKFEGIAGKLAPADVPRVNNLNALCNATETVYFDDANGDLWMNIYYEINLDLFGGQMQMLPVQPIVVNSAIINAGSTNRSGVNKIEAEFDQVVWQAPALRVFNHTTLQVVDVSAATVSGSAQAR